MSLKGQTLKNENLAGEVIRAGKHGNLSVEDAKPSCSSKVWKLSGPRIPRKRGELGRKGLQAEASE